nr:M15 family metallopeptidase [uncultured Acetatifactor sp.]
MDREKILKMVLVLAAIVVIATSLGKLFRRNSMSLTEYAQLNESASVSSAPPQSDDASQDASTDTSDSADDSQQSHVSSLIGASLNAGIPQQQRVSLEEGFYYEPVSDNLRRFMTGISFPAEDPGEIPAKERSETADSAERDFAKENSVAKPFAEKSADAAEDSVRENSAAEAAAPAVTFDELRYVHILHYDFNGEPAEGELICNASIAQDLLEIFRELYRNEYQLESVLLIDEFDGDDTASMEANNTSCFNYRTVEGTERLSKHAYGLAVDINPLYNPYITYAEDGAEQVSPASALPYADRDLSFPYKITEEDLCYRLFIEHGFTWGGHWNNVKDYQHFQKAP